jgi:chorismate mutase
MDNRLTARRARLASAELLLVLRVMTQDTQSTPAGNSGDDPVLSAFRKSIDNIDAALIHMLAERFRITQAVGEYKAKATLPPADPGREARQVARLRKLSEEADLDPEFSEKFLRFIIDEVIRHHEKAQQG